MIQTKYVPKLASKILVTFEGLFGVDLLFGGGHLSSRPRMWALDRSLCASRGMQGAQARQAIQTSSENNQLAAIEVVLLKLQDPQMLLVTHCQSFRIKRLSNTATPLPKSRVLKGAFEPQRTESAIQNHAIRDLNRAIRGV